MRKWLIYFLLGLPVFPAILNRFGVSQ